MQYVCCKRFHRFAKRLTVLLYCQTNKTFRKMTAILVCFAVLRNRYKPFRPKPLSGSVMSTIASLFSCCFAKCSVFRCFAKLFIKLFANCFEKSFTKRMRNRRKFREIAACFACFACFTVSLFCETAIHSFVKNPELEIFHFDYIKYWNEYQHERILRFLLFSW
jgi:hypothetical protein